MIQDAGILQIENKELKLNGDEVVMVEPGERHKIKQATETPFSFIVISTVKEKSDKVVLEY